MMETQTTNAKVATTLYAPYDQLNPSVVKTMEGALEAIGISLVSHSGHSELTAYRLVHYLQYLLAGAEEPHWTVFKNEDPVVSHMVVVPNIPFWSACSHHCLPFTGEISIGYIPNKLLIGLSKIPLIVRYHARGFWLQEHLANFIADHLENLLQPTGIAVYIQAQHTCQLLDLEQPPIPIMKTTVLRGVLMHGQAARSEFYQMIRKEQ